MRRRLTAITFALVSAFFVQACTAEPRTTFVEYQGQRFSLAKAYDDFSDYKDDPQNLTPEQLKSAESLMLAAKFGPRFNDTNELIAALLVRTWISSG